MTVVIEWMEVRVSRRASRRDTNSYNHLFFSFLLQRAKAAKLTNSKLPSQRFLGQALVGPGRSVHDGGPGIRTCHDHGRASYPRPWPWTI
jgi:hypothetical protein